MTVPKRKFYNKPGDCMGFPLDRRGRFNGKPLEHWYELADKLFMQCLISAMNVDTRSLIGAIVHQRFENLAKAVDEKLYQETLAEIQRMRDNLTLFIGAMSGAAHPVQYCEKHRPKTKRPRRKAKKENRVDHLD